MATQTISKILEFLSVIQTSGSSDSERFGNRSDRNGYGWKNTVLLSWNITLKFERKNKPRQIDSNTLIDSRNKQTLCNKENAEISVVNIAKR